MTYILPINYFTVQLILMSYLTNSVGLLRSKTNYSSCYKNWVRKFHRAALIYSWYQFTVPSLVFSFLFVKPCRSCCINVPYLNEFETYIKQKPRIVLFYIFCIPHFFSQFSIANSQLRTPTVSKEIYSYIKNQNIYIVVTSGTV